MRVSSPHPWRLPAKKAARLQTRLARRVSLVPFKGTVRCVAGADVSYDPDTGLFHAAFVLLAWPGLEVLEIGRARGRSGFPYIPGLLSFREIPPLLRAYRKLRLKPGLVICDGHGLAHPRRFGLACHLGILLDIPTLGCAKSRLVGRHGPVPHLRGGRAALRVGGNRVGTVLRTREGALPVFVSPGHRISLLQAAGWTLRCAKGYRLPEPTRLADREVSRMRREYAAGR
jgi:deoxyribonuclease V